MSTATLIACSLLLLVLFAYIFWPERYATAQNEKTRLDYLEERKQQLYENLRDLNFEHRAGKYPDEDFQAQRAQLEQEATDLIAEMDKLEAATRA